MVRPRANEHGFKKSMESRDFFVYTNLAIYGIKISMYDFEKLGFIHLITAIHIIFRTSKKAIVH